LRPRAEASSLTVTFFESEQPVIRENENIAMSKMVFFIIFKITLKLWCDTSVSEWRHHQRMVGLFWCKL